jgi:hypothetical protein
MGDELEFLDTIHALGLLLGVHETAKRLPELFTAWPVGHTA